LFGAANVTPARCSGQSRRARRSLESSRVDDSADEVTDLDQQTQTELEAAVLRTLIGHLNKRSDVQNIDLMIRRASAATAWSNGMSRRPGERARSLDGRGRRQIYGMSYEEWRRLTRRMRRPSSRRHSGR
jgi:hypothetical protein